MSSINVPRKAIAIELIVRIFLHQRIITPPMCEKVSIRVRGIWIWSNRSNLEINSDILAPVRKQGRKKNTKLVEFSRIKETLNTVNDNVVDTRWLHDNWVQIRDADWFITSEIILISRLSLPYYFHAAARSIQCSFDISSLRECNEPIIGTPPSLLLSDVPHLSIRNT